MADKQAALQLLFQYGPVVILSLLAVGEGLFRLTAPAKAQAELLAKTQLRPEKIALYTQLSGIAALLLSCQVLLGLLLQLLGGQQGSATLPRPLRYGLYALYLALLLLRIL